MGIKGQKRFLQNRFYPLKTPFDKQKHLNCKSAHLWHYFNFYSKLLSQNSI
jgi:hypothetical protein